MYPLQDATYTVEFRPDPAGDPVLVVYYQGPALPTFNTNAWVMSVFYARGGGTVGLMVNGPYHDVTEPVAQFLRSLGLTVLIY